MNLEAFFYCHETRYRNRYILTGKIYTRGYIIALLKT